MPKFLTKDSVSGLVVWCRWISAGSECPCSIGLLDRPVVFCTAFESHSIVILVLYLIVAACHVCYLCYQKLSLTDV